MSRKTLRNGVISPGMAWVTSDQAPQSQCTAARDTMLLYGFAGISTAAWAESAVCPKVGRDAVLVDPQQPQTAMTYH